MLEKILSEQIENLEINKMEPCETTMQSIYFDGTEKDNVKWLEVISKGIKTAKYFEIHC